MCMAEYIGQKQKVCWTLCFTTSLTRMRMGREPCWWNLQDSMKFTEEKHQLGSSWPIPMTVMWGGSQRVWGPDPWCNPTPRRNLFSAVNVNLLPAYFHTIISSLTFSCKGLPGPAKQQERAWACWFQRRGRRAAVLHETNCNAGMLHEKQLATTVQQFYTKPTARHCYMKNNSHLQCIRILRSQLHCGSFTPSHLQCNNITRETTNNYCAAVLHVNQQTTVAQQFYYYNCLQLLCGSFTRNLAAKCCFAVLWPLSGHFPPSSTNISEDVKDLAPHLWIYYLKSQS